VPKGQQSARFDPCLRYAGAQEGGAARVLPPSVQGRIQTQEEARVSCLDKLKQDAEQLRSHQNLSQTERDALVLETEAACLTAFRYWVDLSKQLNVLQPAPRGRFVLDSKNAIEGLRFGQYRADIRKKGLASTHDQTDHVALYCSLGTGQTLKLVKDFLPDMEKLEARLTQAGIRCQPEPIRNPDTGKLLEVRYEFVADITAGVRLTPNHDNATVQFQVNNLDGLVRWLVQFEARQVDTALLDELSKWLVGQPNDFVKRGKVLELKEV
jgi:hypothetical protein